jgi:chemotaxis protein CheD
MSKEILKYYRISPLNNAGGSSMDILSNEMESQPEDKVLRVVGMGEMILSNDPQEVLITYALGSCLGVTVYDPMIHVGGMIHAMIPLSKNDLEKSQKRPTMFVDTGVTLLLQKIYEMGAARDRLIVKVAGGAKILDVQSFFNIGDRNYTVLRKVLWKNSLLIQSEEVGGFIPRTMTIDIATGTVWLKTAASYREL